MRRWLAAVLWLGVPGIAHACTVCDSTTGKEVRAGIADGHFLPTLGRVLLPFAVLALAAAGVHFGMPDLRADEDNVCGTETMPGRAMPAEAGGQRP